MRTIKKPLLAYFIITAFIPGHLFSWAVEWGFSVTVALYALTQHLTGRIKPNRFFSETLILLLLLTFASGIGYISALIFRNSQTGGRDLFDLIRPILIFYACAWLSFDDATNLQDIRRASKWILGFSTACAFILIFDIPGLNFIVNLIYGETKTGFSEFRARLSIPFENPNFFGIFSVFCVWMSLTARGQKDWPLTALGVIGVALSGSRTAWVTGLLALSVPALRALFQSLMEGKLLRTLVIVAAFLTTSLIIVNVSDEVAQISTRLTAFVDVMMDLDLSADESYAERIALRENAERLIATYPIFGIGASKYSELDIVDNQYYGLLVRGGFCGLLFFGIVFLRAAHAMWMRCRTSAERADIVLGSSILAIWLWTGSYAENVRVVILIVLILYFVAYAKPNAAVISCRHRPQ